MAYMLMTDLIAPLEDIAPHILKYWKMRKTDIEILNLLKTYHIDDELYGIGCDLSTW